MQKINLTLVSVLVCFLIFALLANGENLWAKSKSSTFEMTSDVLCGTGGKSQSTTFTLKVSVGAQPSPIGKQSSTNFEASAGWVYTSQPSFKRGDANGDGVINVTDIVFLINYLFNETSPPDPLWLGDANSDGKVDIVDIVFLINYLFGEGPPPSCSDKEAPPSFGIAKLNSHLPKAQIGLLVPNLHEGSLERLGDEVEIVVWGKSEQDLAGVQLEIGYDPQEVSLLEPKLTSRTQGLSIFFGGEERVQKIGIVDLTGKNSIRAGEGALVILKAKGIDFSSIQVKKAILATREAKTLSVDISQNLLVKTEISAVEIPDHFSLSQNYPNPFNPETNIEYALSRDTDVKLTIYNILGEKVKVLMDEHQTAGYKRAHWDGRDQKGEEVASGVYFYRLETKEFSKVKKMMLVK